MLFNSNLISTILSCTFLVALATGLNACNNQQKTETTHNQSDKASQIFMVEETAPLIAGESVSNAQNKSFSPASNNMITPVHNSIQTDTQKTAAQSTLQDNSKTAEKQSIVAFKNTSIRSNSPEATLVQALNILYYGNAQDATKYFTSDKPNLSQYLLNTQPEFQKSVRGININEVVYNQDRTNATLKGEIYVTQSQNPQYVEYVLVKENNGWKLLLK